MSDSDSGAPLDPYNKFRLFAHSAVLVLASFNIGIYLAEQETTPSEPLASFLFICASATTIIGAILSGACSEIYGKRQRMVFADIFIILGCISAIICQYIAKLPVNTSTAVMQMFNGFGIGADLAILPVYLREIAPKEVSGFVVVLNPIAILLGKELGYLLCYIGKEKDIREILAFVPPAGIALLQLVLLWTVFTSESPLTLSLYQHAIACRDEIDRLYPTLDRQLDELRVVQFLAAQDEFEPKSFVDLFRRRNRGSTFLGLFVVCLRHFQGVVMLILFVPTLFDGSIFWGIPTDLALNSLALVLALFPLFFVDVLGRRVITILGAWAIAAANTCEFLAVLVFGTDVSTTVSAGFAILVIGLYSLSTNAVSVVYATEILTEKGFAMGMACSTLIAAVMRVLFQHFNTGDMMIWCQGMFSVLSAASAMAAWKWLPETMAMSQAEIIEMMQAREHSEAMVGREPAYSYSGAKLGQDDAEGHCN